MNGADGGRRAYIGSYTSAGGRGITTAAVHPDTGELAVLHHTDVVADPSYLTLGPGAGLLYAVGETEDGTAAALSLTDPDRPCLIGAAVSVGGAGPTHLTCAAGQLITANYTSGSISSLPLRPDGTPGAPPTVLRHHGSGPVRERQEGPHAHAVVADASWRWLLAVDLGTDSVWIYRLDHTGAAPLPHGRTPLRPGSGPRHLAFHPRGERAYVINELESTVTVCRWDRGTGTLEPVGEVSTLPGDAGAGENYPSELVVSVDGRWAWAANRGHDSIAVLALDPGSDGMELVTTVPCGGHWPRDLALDPAGRRLYAANERSGDVTWFDLDPDTGVPHRAGSIEAPAATCVVFG
ncbi:MAG TPA: lactonase family protein [Streptomyces sp.]|uniref:lactonase family protein n=1 Tax=Streptomyces sp. TaxID=1931 RepID=UPI002D3EB81A|nr:lactonase family protein [Streptomyces sp.]HZG03841.1 lactonase family protein [Streptomyces sp.]